DQEVNNFNTAKNLQISSSKSFSNPRNEYENETRETKYSTESVALLEEIEGKRDAQSKIERKTLVDFVLIKCEQMFMGSYRGLLGREVIFLERREILTEEVKKEVQGSKKPWSQEFAHYTLASNWN
ncbi:hypothetical protein ISN45_Aa06g026950, partial [Arabidopsis thaliana x Arabidopsis arenosa]